MMPDSWPPRGEQQLVFQGPVRSGFLTFFGQDRDWTGLQKFPFWEKTEPGKTGLHWSGLKYLSTLN